jgi:hypothetical protein
MTRDRSLKNVTSIRSASYFIAGVFLLIICISHWTGNHLGDTNCSVECRESMVRVETYWREECVGEGSCQYCATQI